MRPAAPRSKTFRRVLLAVSLAWLPAIAAAQGWNPDEVLKKEGWVKPPAVVERIITATRTDISYSVPSPDRKWFVRTAMPDRGDIRDYGKQHIYLAGLAVDVKANRARQMTMRAGTGAHARGSAHQRATKSPRSPEGATVTSPTWSPSGRKSRSVANFRCVARTWPTSGREVDAAHAHAARRH
jgi:hypothetical protein